MANILAKILIQIGTDEPREIGTINIPIKVGAPEQSRTHSAFHVPLTPHIDPAKVAAEVRKQLSYYQGM